MPVYMSHEQNVEKTTSRRKFLLGASVPLVVVVGSLIYDRKKSQRNSDASYKTEAKTIQIIRGTKLRESDYFELEDRVFRIYPVQANSGDGTLKLIDRSWSKYANEEDIEPIRNPNFTEEENIRYNINLVNLANNLYMNLHRNPDFLASLQKGRVRKFDYKNFSGDPVVLRENKTYKVPIPTRFKSLEQIANYSRP